VLRHDNRVKRIIVSLLPSTSRLHKKKERFATFQRDFVDFSELPRIIHDASRLIGVRGFSDFANAPTFAVDVLRLELVGNIALYLILVDLPGLISVSEDKEDVLLV